MNQVLKGLQEFKLNFEYITDYYKKDLKYIMCILYYLKSNYKPTLVKT